MRAITWAEDFDLNHHLDDAVESLSGIRFSTDPETIIKCVGLTLGIPPTTVGLLELRNRNPKELKAAFQAAKEGLVRVAAFAAEFLSIHSAKCIPYEGQLLLLFKTIGMNEATGDDIDLISRGTGRQASTRVCAENRTITWFERWIIGGDLSEVRCAGSSRV
jgi:hypothetical protein